LIEFIAGRNDFRHFEVWQSVGSHLGDGEMSVREIIENRTYYARRAREERAKAATCEDNSVAIIHLELAEKYDERARSLISVTDPT
jgi:hypothetical protein